MEETGFSVDPKIFLPKKLIFFRTFFEPTKQVYSVICGWWLNAVTELTAFEPNRVILSNEHTAFAWVSLAELSHYDFGGVRGSFITETIRTAFNVKTAPNHSALDR